MSTFNRIFSAHSLAAATLIATATSSAQTASAPAPRAETIVSLPAPPATIAASGTLSVATASATPAVSALVVARLHHAPIAIARAGEPIALRAVLDAPQLVKRALVIYRAADGALVEAPFLRASSDYLAEIPASAVRGPVVSYAIELEGLDGTRTPVFGSRAAMHDVAVEDDADDARERRLLDAIEGRRSVFSLSGDYVTFGRSNTTPSAGSGTPVASISDRYGRVDGAYTYRPLRGVVEFTVRVGGVRGTSPTADLAGSTDRNVGLNYAAPSILVRAHDFVHLEGELLTSITQAGFSTGFGGAVHLGAVYGTKLVLGFEYVQTFGSRFFMKLDMIATPRLRLSPIVEVTDMPNADHFGVRLLGEAAYNLGDGFTFVGRAGYQARDFNSGGLTVGSGVRYAF